MRPPVFAKQQYDGVEDDSDDSDDELPPAGTIGRLAAEMKLSDAPDFEEFQKAMQKDHRAGKGLGDNIDEEMRQRVWGEDEAPQIVDLGEDGRGEEDGDVDMTGEEEEFLRFTRDTLGISEDQWQGIIGSRRDRGG